MTKQEILAKITALSKAAEGFEGMTKTFKLNDISNLKIALEGMALQDIANKMNAISLPDIAEMDNAISAANDAIAAQNARVQGFNTAFSILKSTLGVMI